jgi:hypothetical protein
VSKCQVVVIRCEVEQVEQDVQVFPCQAVSFTIRYLGMPLLVHKMLKSALQPLLDNMVDRLLAWRGKLMHRNGRLALIKSTLAAIPVYTVISYHLTPWFQKAMTKIFTAFLWIGTEVAHGGKCLVAWKRVQHPLQLGGLGIMDFNLLGRALCLRWLYLSWTDPERPWALHPVVDDAVTEAFFQASITCMVGDGEPTFF